MSNQDLLPVSATVRGFALRATRRWMIGAGPTLGVVAAACRFQQAAPTTPSFSGPPVQIHAFVRQPVRLFGEIMEKRVRDYEAARQRQVTVLWEAEADQMTTKLSAMISAGNSPTVTDLNLDQVRAYMARGLVRTLDPLVKRDRYSLQDFYPRLIEASRWRDELARIPYYAAPYPLYFSRDLFQAKGVALPTKDWTWKNLREAALKLANPAQGIWGFEAPNGLDTGWSGYYWGEGQELLNKDLTEFLINTPRAVEVVDWYASLRFKDRVAPSSADLQGQNRDVMFANGKIAMYMAPFSRANQLIELSQGLFEWDIQQPPKGSVKREHRLGDGGLSIPVGAPHVDQGWDFIQWMCNVETQREWAGHRLNMPSRRSVAESDAFLKTRPPNTIRAMADMMDTARHLWPVPADGLAGIFSSGMLSVMNGQQAAREACLDMKRRADALLQESRPTWQALARG